MCTQRQKQLVGEFTDSYEAMQRRLNANHIKNEGKLRTKGENDGDPDPPLT